MRDSSLNTVGARVNNVVISGTRLTANAINYVLQDVEGSTRVVMSGTTVIARHDYLPFGEEIGAGVGMRTPGQGFDATDRVRQRYGMTERDDATGLDHTWWRKYENFAGRWTSPDPYLGSMTLANPQSFNRYAYVQNDPVNFVDPTGLYQVCTTGSDGKITCREVGGAPGVQLDGGPIFYTGPRETVYDWRDDLPGALTGGGTFIPMSSGQTTPGRTPTSAGLGALPQPIPQPHPSPSPNPQQNEFDNCTAPAKKRYWDQFPKAAGKTIAGGAGLAIGIALLKGAPSVGFGINAAAKTLAPPLSGRALFNALGEIRDGAGIALPVNLLSGLLLANGLKELTGNRKQFEAAVEECAKKWPLANHSIPF